MIQKINNRLLRRPAFSGTPRNDTRGQTALILILLAAAALIFLAITLNWGRITQVKSLLTISADGSSSTLASDVASYGEMQKQTYLQNANFKSSLTGVLLDVILVVVSIVVTILTWGAGATAAAILWTQILLVTSIAMSVVALSLQLAVINPMISRLWNNLQKNQPIQQQFYEEGGIGPALQGSVTDQVNITDYFDWNANGVFGNNASGFSKDTVGRFAVFYTERLKMLNQPLIPQVVFFYNQLGELMNGETCAQNAIDNCLNSNIPLNPQCPSDCAVSNPYTTNNSCAETSSDPVCQLKVPNGFQLNDACADSDPGSPGYNPYCDPCCQPVSVPNPLYCPACSAQSSTCNCTTSGSTSTCTSTNANGTCTYNPLVSQYVSFRPSNCDQSVSPAQCLKNNPYGSTTANPYTLLYDPAYQEYSNGLSFLDQFGRDQPMGPFTTSLTPQGLFPNGIYPFFWLMKDYSPEVDNIVSTNLQSSQGHWCTAATAPGYTAPAGYSDLAQLSLPYACSGQDCCVNGLANSVTNGIPTITTVSTLGGTTSWVIDAVGSSSLASTQNPALDPSFGDSATTLWQEGDNQMCLSAPPYNGSTSSIPDGTCEWNGTASAPASTTPGPTMDSLDDTMHTLSDFVNFANSFLGQDVGTLSASFATWYPQVAVWISSACDDGSTCSAAGQCSDGTMCGRLLPLAPKLNTWNTVMTTWLKNDNSNANAWCVPPEATLLNGNNSTAEDTYINNNSGTTTWGDLPHVIACLNYNVGTPISNYQACLNALPQNSCPSQLPAACAASTLGRSLAGPAPTFNGSCDITVAGSYAKWVSDSLILATNEAPKFVLRSAFLTDIQTRAKAMQNIFNQGGQELQNFLNGPAAQLMAASQTQPTATLPNSVIYGWIDKKLPNGQTGYAHIVKVTAYAAGRNGSGSTANSMAQSLLPWIKTTVHLFTRDFELRSRDGYVYVSVKRWDEDHSNSLIFPNGRPLWQFMFHNPATATNGSNNTPQIGKGSIGSCAGLNSGIGFGLEPQTVAGLQDAGILSTDQTSLSQAFMLNDEGAGQTEGQVDPSAKTNNSQYLSCLSQANALLANAPESHACVEYIASSNASGSSGQGDHDYSLKFVDCNSVPGYPPPDDLTGSGNL